MITLGEVVNITDVNNGGRIRVRVRPTDNIIKNNEDVPFAYPLLPKMLHVKPKLNELVFIIFADDNNKNSQRYYIGPVISQPQFFENQLYGGGASNLLQGAIMAPAPSLKQTTEGLLPSNKDVALSSRKNTDILLKDNDVQIRCGVKLLKNQNIEFNKKNPAFLKLKYYESPIGIQQGESYEEFSSTATLYADKINLIGANGAPYIGVSNKEDLLNDNTILNILKEAHQLPYGDTLCDLLSELIKVFKNHTHNYNNLPIVKDPNYVEFVNKYGEDGSNLKEILLSKTVRIN